MKSTKFVGNTYTKEVGPVNTFLNTIINLDVKGVSKLYRIRNSGKTNILIDIATKWKNKTGEIFTNEEIEHAFIINPKSNVNMYMKYIQYRFLHYRVATKYELFKMNIVEFSSEHGTQSMQN